MQKQSSTYQTKHIARIFTATLLCVCVCVFATGTAEAASSWNPTLLVNTTSKMTIDDGNGTSNIELRFGQTLNEKLFYNRSQNRFQFTRSLYVGGDLTATGSLSVKKGISGATLRIDGNSDIWGNLGASGSLKIGGTTTLNGATTITGNTKVRGNLSGSTLNVDGNSILKGSLSATGAISTNSNITINSDNDTNDATFTFGNQTSAQTLKYSHANQRFEFSKDVKVTGNVHASGNLSGSTLTVGGNVTLRGVTYAAPTSQGASNTFLKNDGAGNLTWTATSNANGSGGALSLHPQYPNAVYAQSGSTAIGELTQGADATNKELFYRWQGDEATIQDYWIWARVKVPKNFSNWTPTPIQFRYRTSSTSAAVNHLTVRLLDTTGANVPITGGAALASGSANTWTTASIGNVSGGTYTPDGFITILIKLASTTSGFADAGYLNINWSTTTP